jgi:hypothetical protein
MTVRGVATVPFVAAKPALPLLLRRNPASCGNGFTHLLRWRIGVFRGRATPIAVILPFMGRTHRAAH